MVIESGKTAIDAAKSLVDGVKETEEGLQAHQELGKTALTVTKAINNVLLPIAAVNFGFDKARVYFQNSFAKDLAEATKEIPPDQLKEPKASVAAPVLQGLGFSHEEPSLKEMYLGLLRSAMDSRLIDGDHPSFSEIVRQLSAVEAEALLKTFEVSTSAPIVEIIAKNHKGSFRVLVRNVLNTREEISGAPVVVDGLSVMVDNWVRLGLFSVDYHKSASGSDPYAWVKNRPEFQRKQDEFGTDFTVTFHTGILEATDYGRAFMRAVR